MNETLFNLLLLPVAAILYASGLLLWLIRRWLHRKQKVHGKTLAIVCICQLIAYVVVAIFVHVQHIYYWFIFLMELNLVFTIAGICAWVRDARYEREVEANQTNP